MVKIHTTYLSLGSNIENRILYLQKAVDLLAERVGEIQKISSVYQTASWGFKSDDFLNICLKITTVFSAEELLEKTQHIEFLLHRKKSEEGLYTDRTIDIDVLFFDDEITESKTLTAPHPLLHKRNFVLMPLNEIASDKIHPILKKTICELLKNCKDTTFIQKHDTLLTKPLTLAEKYKYIAFEGNIGVGKTTFATMISEVYNAKLVTERFAENPFLPKFYSDADRYAFPLEMSFLADRYQQLSEDLAQYDLFKNFVVSDYYIFKSLIFSKATLSKEEYLLYRKIFNLMYKDIVKPDLYVYLYQSNERLLQNIKKRGREYEQNIKVPYLEKIQQGYLNFIKTETSLNTKIIDITSFDFVKSKSDFQKIISFL